MVRAVGVPAPQQSPQHFAAIDRAAAPVDIERERQRLVFDPGVEAAIAVGVDPIRAFAQFVALDPKAEIRDPQHAGHVAQDLGERLGIDVRRLVGQFARRDQALVQQRSVESRGSGPGAEPGTPRLGREC